MINRAIVIFPKFENVESINAIREVHDPLFKYIDPHVTLVFPFQSELTTEILTNHLSKQLEGLRTFPLVARGISGTSDGYVFLDIKIGNDHIIELHDRLYSDLLKPYLNRFIPYTPHITVGRLSDRDEHKAVIESLTDFNTEFIAEIDRIIVERIDEAEQSITEIEYVF